MIVSRIGKSTTPSGRRREGYSNVGFLKGDHNIEIRPQSDVVGSTLYVSHHLTFSQLCLQMNEEQFVQSFDLAYPTSATSIPHVSRHNLQRSIKAGGRGSVMRVVGSQLVTVLKDDQQAIRRSTLSTITQKFAEKRSVWMVDAEAGVNEEDSEEAEKQRKHRAKAEKVLALLQLEQEALLREEQEESDRKSQESREQKELEDVESVRRERTRARICLELDNLAAAESDDGQSEGEDMEDWQLDKGSTTSSRWAWDEVSEQNHRYREEMRILVTDFVEAEAKVWRQIISRHKHSSCSDGDRSGRSGEPFAALTNSQLRGGTSEILQLQAKRQRQLNECAEMQNLWRGAPYLSSTWCSQDPQGNAKVHL
ncbi:hypothetical protein J3R30DRAFT_3693815 [Lentinula aciculospora]|uniref:Uncharacterized protein n=1 Tax=Lentinula aciculospora TaxID=153920 RepID=A0A9W9ATM2_9AGAR|nr:hypothetical protein J3R30DRAFT_3693815 [Lentinula aciculospora]